MIPFGSKRTLGGCTTKKLGRSRKVIVIENIKNRKLGRVSSRLKLVSIVWYSNQVVINPRIRQRLPRLTKLAKELI